MTGIDSGIDTSPRLTSVCARKVLADTSGKVRRFAGSLCLFRDVATRPQLVDWQIRVDAGAEMTATPTTFELTAWLEAFEGGKSVCRREWRSSHPRVGM